MQASVRGVLAGALIWLVVATIAAVEFWPYVPGSVGGWVLFLAFAPPLYLLAQAVADWAWTTRPARFVSEHPSRFVRISLGVVIGGLLFAAVTAIWITVNSLAHAAVV